MNSKKISLWSSCCLNKSLAILTSTETRFPLEAKSDCVFLYSQGKGEMTTWWLLSYELKKSTVLPGNQSKRHNGTINGKIPNGFPGNKTEDGPPTSDQGTTEPTFGGPFTLTGSECEIKDPSVVIRLFKCERTFKKKLSKLSFGSKIQDILRGLLGENSGKCNVTR